MILVAISQLFVSGLLLGLGLTMDACAVSMANGLEEPKMKLPKMVFIAFMYAFFQAGMPLIGYFFGHLLFENLPFIEKYHIIPIVALVLLLIIGGHMLIEGIKDVKSEEEHEPKKLTFKLIFIQAIATSIDALSTGLTFADYGVLEALLVVGLIALVTFVVCMIALFIGKKFGDKLGPWAIILGGIILIAIGIEIFITGIWF